MLKRPDCVDDRLTKVWFRNEEGVRRNLQWLILAGRNDDVDRRPSISHVSSQFQSVHRARHVDIGED